MRKVFVLLFLFVDVVLCSGKKRKCSEIDSEDDRRVFLKRSDTETIKTDLEAVSCNEELDLIDFGLDEDKDLFESQKQISPSDTSDHDQADPLNDTTFFWNVHDESEWTLSTRELAQYHVITSDPFAPNMLEFVETDYFAGKYSFDRIWPHEVNVQRRSPSKLFLAHQAYALHLLLNKGKLRSFKTLAKCGLIDFSRPVYESKVEICRSFLSIAVETYFVEDEKVLLVIKLTPQKMIDWPGFQGMSPLEWAIRLRRYTLIHALLECGADINKIPGDNRKTPFMVALNSGDVPFIRYLLSSDRVDPNIMLSDGTNLIVMAAKHMCPLKFPKYFWKIVAGAIPMRPETFARIIGELYSEKSPILNQVIAAVGKRPQATQFTLILLNSAYEAIIQDDLYLLEFMFSQRIPIEAIGAQLLKFAINLKKSEIVSFLVEILSSKAVDFQVS